MKTITAFSLAFMIATSAISQSIVPILKVQLPLPTAKEEAVFLENADKSFVKEALREENETAHSHLLIGDESEIPDVISDTEELAWEQAPIPLSEDPVPVNYAAIRSVIGYPDAARAALVEGTVIVDVQIDQNGYYKGHTLVNKAHSSFIEAVEGQLHKLRFTPAIQNGQPVDASSRLSFAFVLNLIQ